MSRFYTKQSTSNPVHQQEPGHWGVYIGHWKLNLTTGKFGICTNARKILGFGITRQSSLEDVLGLVSYSDRSALIRSFKNALATSSNMNMELQLPSRNGRKWVLLTGMFAYRRWGVPDHLIGTIEDTTQRRAEENLNLAIIGHEIRNPLSIIKLNAEMAMKMMEPARDFRQLRLLSRIDEHIDGIASVLDERLSVSAGSNRRLELQISTFDLHTVLDRLICEMQVLNRQYRFERDYKGKMWVSADKNRIIRVLINYMMNAVKFSQPCSVIRISSGIRQGFAEISVADEGVGIPKGWEERIFEQHSVCPDRKGRQQNSKGLGLYLVKKIIDGHGGKVRAEQVKDGGAAFFFSLPLLQEAPKRVLIY